MFCNEEELFNCIYYFLRYPYVNRSTYARCGVGSIWDRGTLTSFVSYFRYVIFNHSNPPRTTAPSKTTYMQKTQYHKHHKISPQIHLYIGSSIYKLRTDHLLISYE